MPESAIQGDSVSVLLARTARDLPGWEAISAHPIVVIDPPPGGDVRQLGGAETGELRVVADDVVVQRRHAGALAGLTPTLLADARLVLLYLPRSLAALEEAAQQVSAWAHPDVTLVAAGKVAHMSRGMNEVLARRFSAVHATLGFKKARALVASDPRPGPLDFPRSQQHADVELTLCAHGRTFAGTKIDHGSRLLASCLPAKGAGRGLDLGCGNGFLAALLARAGFEVTATDASAAACASTVATAAANGLGMAVVQGDAGDTVEGPFDLIVCNPPFHRGAAKDSTVAFTMIEAAARLLSPDGRALFIFNAHLPYLPALRRAIGPTQILARNPHFIVTSSRPRLGR